MKKQPLFQDEKFIQELTRKMRYEVMVESLEDREYLQGQPVQVQRAFMATCDEVDYYRKQWLAASMSLDVKDYEEREANLKEISDLKGTVGGLEKQIEYNNQSIKQLEDLVRVLEEQNPKTTEKNMEF